VEKSDIGTCREAQPTSPGESRRPDGSDTPPTGTPPSEFATPRGQSPERVDWGANLTERQGNGESTDEADTLPPWSKEMTSDILSKINTYKYVRLVELMGQERADLPERQGNGGSTDEPDTSSTGPRVTLPCSREITLRGSTGESTSTTTTINMIN